MFYTRENQNWPDGNKGWAEAAAKMAKCGNLCRSFKVNMRCYNYYNFAKTAFEPSFR